MQGKQYSVKTASATPVRKKQATVGAKSTGQIPYQTVTRELRVKAVYAALAGNSDKILTADQFKQVACSLNEFSNMTNHKAIGNEVCWWGAECPESKWIRDYFEFIRTGDKVMHIKVKATAKTVAPVAPAKAPARKGKAKATKAKATQQALPL